MDYIMKGVSRRPGMETMPKPGCLQGKPVPPLDVMLVCGVVFAVVWCPSCVFLVSVSCLFSSLMADGMVSYRVFLSCFFFLCFLSFPLLCFLFSFSSAACAGRRAWRPPVSGRAWIRG